jgi:hypothetical protein
MESGLSSASAVQLRNTLSTVLPGVSLPAVFAFDFLTAANISQELVFQLGPSGFTLLVSLWRLGFTSSSKVPVGISWIRFQILFVPWVLHPVSFFQEQMLMAYLVDPYSEVYNLSTRLSPLTQSIGISSIRSCLRKIA